MSFGYILAWMVAFSSGALLWQLVHANPGRNRGWITIHSFVIAFTLAIFFLVDEDWAGYLGAEVWLFLVGLPNLLLRRVQRLALDGHYAKARGLAIVASWLHPVDGWRELPRALLGLELDSRGESARAESVLMPLMASPNPLARLAIARRLAAHGRWDELVGWMERTRALADFRQESVVLSSYLRALGETGRLEALAREFLRAEPALLQSGRSASSQCRLFLFAFCGRVEETRALFEGPLAGLSAESRLFWLSTAELAAGNADAGRTGLEVLSRIPDARFQQDVRRRLSHPVAHAEAVLGEGGRRALDEILAGWRAEHRYGEFQSGRLARPYATYALIAVNGAVFLLESLLGGTTDLDTLLRMGALIVEPGIPLEPWRLVAATFLHFGFLHISMNMLALYLIGPFVESTMGRMRYLACYLGSGVLSMVGVYELAGLLHAQVLVGASGSIMGLIGATAAILLKFWRVERNPVAMRRLRSTILIILFQFGFDLSTKEVSFTAHVGGLIFGFLIALCLVPSRPR